MDIDLGFRILLYDEPLRLWGVDTPEIRGEEKAEGVPVRDLVKTWLPEGSTTIIRTLRSKDGEDATGTFHRYLVIIRPEGWSESVDARLLREGHAEVEASSAKELARIKAAFGL